MELVAEAERLVLAVPDLYPASPAHAKVELRRAGRRNLVSEVQYAGGSVHEGLQAMRAAKIHLQADGRDSAAINISLAAGYVGWLMMATGTSSPRYFKAQPWRLKSTREYCTLSSKN